MINLKKELSPIILLIASIVLAILLLPVGLIHLILKSIYNTMQIRFWRGPIYFIKYWIKVAYQIWNVFKFFCMKIAIGVDLFGNVTCGEAIEDCVTLEEDTMYGKGEITISTATGEIEYKNKLNKIGLKFSKILSILLDNGHCVASYKRYLHNQSFKLE